MITPAAKINLAIDENRRLERNAKAAERHRNAKFKYGGASTITYHMVQLGNVTYKVEQHHSPTRPDTEWRVIGPRGWLWHNGDDSPLAKRILRLLKAHLETVQ